MMAFFKNKNLVEEIVYYTLYLLFIIFDYVVFYLRMDSNNSSYDNVTLFFIGSILYICLSALNCCDNHANFAYNEAHNQPHQ